MAACVEFKFQSKFSKFLITLNIFHNFAKSTLKKYIEFCRFFKSLEADAI